MASAFFASDADRIRRRAYEIWEVQGRPEGKALEHWTQAEREVAADEGGPGLSLGIQPPPREHVQPRPPAG